MTDILFLAHRIPFPPDRGDKIRSFHVLRHLAGLGRVHLACFADDEADAAHLSGLRAALGDRLGETQVEVRGRSRWAAALAAFATGRPLSLALFGSARLQAFVDARLADPKVAAIYAFSGQMAQFVPTRPRQRFVMDFVDADSAKFEAYAAQARGPFRWMYDREARRLGAFEAGIAARADTSLLVSEAEAALFRARTGAARVEALSNGIDHVHFAPDADVPDLPMPERGEGPLLLFTGQMDYRPNVEAVRWFAQEVMPLVPGARFVIAGRSPTAEVRALASPQVVVTGAVDDMRSWLAAADVVVAPLLTARGIQNKVLEAMAMARPVIASPAAFEGVDAQPGRDLLVAAGPEEWAATIRMLLDDRERRAQIGAAARTQVLRRYDWEAQLAPLAGMLGLTRPAPAAEAA